MTGERGRNSSLCPPEKPLTGHAHRADNHQREDRYGDFRHQGVSDGFKSLAEVQHVTYDTEADPKNSSKLRAVNVRAAISISLRRSDAKRLPAKQSEQMTLSNGSQCRGSVICHG